MPRKKDPIAKGIDTLADALKVPKPKRKKASKPKTKTTKKKAVSKPKRKSYKVYKTIQQAKTVQDKQAGLNRIIKVSGGFHVVRVGASKAKKSK